MLNIDIVYIITTYLKLFNILLIQEDAQESTKCHVRETLCYECFDKLIQQITINCLEIGSKLKMK